MGLATCHQLAAAGHPVAVLDLDGGRAERAAEELRANGAEALGLGVDVGDKSAVTDAFEKVRSDLGPTLVLVTSSGLSEFSDFGDISPDDWHRVLDVNLTGTFYCCQAALPDMTAVGWGRIITISSSSAQRGSPRMAHYAAAKGGVISMTKSMAREFAKNGVTVNSIPPSGIETPMQHQQQTAGDLPSNDVMAASIPLGHLGTADDIAAAVMFLASDAAGFITGQVLGVNGGSVL